MSLVGLRLIQVAEILRQWGHKVTSPTLSGLGERRHLLSRSITISTHVEDIVQHILAEELEEVSFGRVSPQCQTLFLRRLQSLACLSLLTRVHACVPGRLSWTQLCGGSDLWSS